MTSNEATTGAFSNLRGATYMNLTTYRKNGAAVTTPVWFAEVDGALYVVTQANAGKVKRIRATKRVQVAPSTVRGQATGPTAEGVGRVLPASEWGPAKAALDKKYGWQKRLFDLLARLRGGESARAYLEIRPA